MVLSKTRTVASLLASELFLFVETNKGCKSLYFTAYNSASQDAIFWFYDDKDFLKPIFTRAGIIVSTMIPTPSG